MSLSLYHDSGSCEYLKRELKDVLEPYAVIVQHIRGSQKRIEGTRSTPGIQQLSSTGSEDLKRELKAIVNCDNAFSMTPFAREDLKRELKVRLISDVNNATNILTSEDLKRELKD